jgi:hypothetical protein
VAERTVISRIHKYLRKRQLRREALYLLERNGPNLDIAICLLKDRKAKGEDLLITGSRWYWLNKFHDHVLEVWRDGHDYL